MTDGPPRVRIAPSPTGDPHVGTAYVALFNRAFARSSGGAFVLRIDDTDRTRYQETSETQIFEALRWLGLTWDEGPDIGGPFGPYRQSERTDIYRQRAEELVDRGLAYHCFCTPERLEQLRETQRIAKQDPGYDRHCRGLSSEEAAAKLREGGEWVIRLKVPESGQTVVKDELRDPITFENSAIDDQVLLKSDGFPTYHLANCVDDLAMGITHVIRAEEWITSTPKHVILYRALGDRVPKFVHVPLLRNADKSKISKRKNPVSLNYYREQGYLPEALKNYLATLGWRSPDEREYFDEAFFAATFRPEDISLGGPVFDLDKLRWLNGMHLRNLDPADLRRRLEDEGFISGVDETGLRRIFPLVADRMHLLSDFAQLTSWFFGEPDEYQAEQLVVKKSTPEATMDVLAQASAAFGDLDDYSPARVEAYVEEKREEWGLKKPQLFMPVRFALTGRGETPPVHEVIAVLGRERVVARLNAARAKLEAASV
ncbi:MAG: glutamate--tRNA ligase [Planctomycetes bacterium]|nr:glutamate--tRNA ligase [Planctomycetota bacterium]